MRRVLVNCTTMDYCAWRLYFERVIAVPEAEINLAEAALILAGDEYPELDVSHYLAQLDEMANALRTRLTDPSPEAVIPELNRYLFQELGFVGNRTEYYDPRNSYLNDVLERRTGLPITLSVIVLALAKRLDLPIVGVGLPGHFVVKWDDGEHEIVFDPFERGKVLDREEIKSRVRDTFHPHAEFQAEWLTAVSAKYILSRMLNNLKAIFLQNNQIERAWQVVDKLLLLDPRAATEIRDMGLLSLRLGAYRQAAISLEEYLLSHADAPDADQVRLYLRAALAHVERLN
ncbi:MAG TPA: tetratricopeptide repeat protein [Anaerolineae bacterium]|nr:tetratricopeptide repeat protein [Anaerolineae bacterium]